jgi:tetratricopeptide (TPR) repeat protein
MSAFRLRKRRYLLLAMCMALPMSSAFATARQQQELAECGTQPDAPPFAKAAPRRDCPTAQARAYTPRHRGIAFDVLDMESEACFVPDSAYVLLDKIVDETVARLTPQERAIQGMPTKAQAIALSKAFHATLIANGFGLYIPTQTLADALVSRSSGGPDSYIEDCDTASILLMTVAESLGIRSNLVEITLRSGAGHNYVRWPLRSGFIDWDTNRQTECQTPLGQPSYQGRAMAPAEAMGYFRYLRGFAWKRRNEFDKAAQDFQRAIQDRSDSPEARNGLAWLVASREWPGRKSLYAQAVSEAEQAITLQSGSGNPRITYSSLANFKDTLACLQAYAGDFGKAAETEKEAIALSYDQDFKEHLARFTAPNPRDCTGD